MSSNLKKPLMIGALAVSAWLALWGDKTPVDDGGVVAPLASSERSDNTPRADETPRPLVWTPRDPELIQAWAQTGPDPFRPLDAPAVQAAAVSLPAASASTPAPTRSVLDVIGRGQTPDGRDAVFVRVADEVLSLNVGSRVAGLQVVAIEPQRLQLRQLKNRHLISLPLNTPHGVFDQSVDVPQAASDPEKTPP